MNSEVQKFYHQEIKRINSLENAVDTFWLNVLPDYSSKKNNFGIEQEAHAPPEISEHCTEWTIRYIRKGHSRKLVLMTNRRGGRREISTRAWAEGLVQLTDYLQLVRSEDGQDLQQTLYGAVDFGTRTRFYQWSRSETECTDYPGTNGKVFEVEKDEEEVHLRFMELVAKASY